MLPSALFFSHINSVLGSVTVPSPLSTYASAPPARTSPSCPVPLHGSALPTPSQQVVCPVAGNDCCGVPGVAVGAAGVVVGDATAGQPSKAALTIVMSSAMSTLSSQPRSPGHCSPGQHCW